jgi:hypothetical protein
MRNESKNELKRHEFWKTLCNHAINQWLNWNVNVTTDIHSLTNIISMVAKIIIGIVHGYPYLLWNQDWVCQVGSQYKR